MHSFGRVVPGSRDEMRMNIASSASALNFLKQLLETS